MLELAAGATCAGINCLKSLWLYTGPSETDNKDLQYCTPACLRSRHRRKKDLHINKLHIIQLCLEEKYNLTHTDIYQEPRLVGASLIKKLQTFTNNGYKSKIKTVTPEKVLGGTSKIATWNMQGVCNVDLAKTFLSKQKPVALWSTGVSHFQR